ncbi:MAG: hypothetical protein F6J94_00845 [Moorea sp. SIO1F2]|uniref:hypothetical protein n=1 Tax=unclassified Moorena TaxID=2683338 RepID=UPI0013B7B8D5|nr:MULTISPECIES: hypothetical protein [unclassified Moorena]NEN96416.1 hypothetical protein [Moorena sp. SIO3I7]NEO06682.1 hypothetical protein [Moorena sp. SIO3I8]NET80582.1 hypothetical protein [Moorena sp. SIO1F2]
MAILKKGNRESGIGSRESEPTPNPSQEGNGNRESGIWHQNSRHSYTDCYINDQHSAISIQLSAFSYQ